MSVIQSDPSPRLAGQASLVAILAPIVHVLTSPLSLGRWTREIENPVLPPPYMEEGGVLISFAAQCCDPQGFVKL